MWLVLMALKRPITILVAVMSIALCSIMAIRQMKVDIFPKLGAPAIYVAQPFGGMDPSQMEGYLTYYYEYHFLYITGIEHVESKNIQGVSLPRRLRSRCKVPACQTTAALPKNCVASWKRLPPCEICSMPNLWITRRCG